MSLLVDLTPMYTHTHPNPIVFIDARVSMYKILGLMSQAFKALSMNTDSLNQWLRANWALIVNDPMPFLPSPSQGYRVIIGDDYKRELDGKYWRSDVLPSYKGNRTAVGDKDPIENQAIQVLRDYLEDSPIKIFRQEGMECDDIAGLATRVKKDDDRTLFLYTVDSDWMQLVDDSRGIIFLNQHIHPPRVRTDVEVLQWCFDQGWPACHPTSVVNMKMAEGDSSDNIPPNFEHGEEIINLRAWPKSQHCAIIDELETEVNQTGSNTNKDHANHAYAWLKSNNLPIVIR